MVDPTPEEIKERSEEIRKNWSEKTFRKRSGITIDEVLPKVYKESIIRQFDSLGNNQEIPSFEAIQ